MHSQINTALISILTVIFCYFAYHILNKHFFMDSMRTGVHRVQYSAVCERHRFSAELHTYE